MTTTSLPQCSTLACSDVDRGGHIVASIDVDPASIEVVLISESPPSDPADHYYSAGEPLFAQTTIHAFREAGVAVDSMADLLDLGVYCTTAVKCPKVAYGISTATIATCAPLLDEELAQFPNTAVYLLMGDVAIKAINTLARRAGEPRPIPAGATYKIRGGTFSFRGVRLFPSYLQAGPAFFIERSKRQMIAEDIAAALALVA